MGLLGFIGAGNMGYAMMKGAVSCFDTTDITYTDVCIERLNWVKEQMKIDYVKTNKECVNKSKLIVLAVKPKYYKEVLKDIHGVITENHIIISIAPGITINSIKEQIGKDKRVIRAMPNTPAMVGEGQTAIAFSDDDYSQNEKTLVLSLFNSFGKLSIIEESLMNSVVPITGSSPAYVFMFIEALADGAVKLGFPRKQAYEMVAQVVLGSAKMVLETGEHPAVLKDQVCSPGGTTIEAVAELEKYGFRNALLQAVDRCYDKCNKI